VDRVTRSNGLKVIQARYKKQGEKKKTSGKLPPHQPLAEKADIIKTAGQGKWHRWTAIWTRDFGKTEAAPLGISSVV